MNIPLVVYLPSCFQLVPFLIDCGTLTPFTFPLFSAYMLHTKKVCDAVTEITYNIST